MGKVERSRQIQQERMETMRSSSRRDLSFDTILAFFAGGSSTSSASAVETVGVASTGVSCVSDS